MIKDLFLSMIKNCYDLNALIKLREEIDVAEEVSSDIIAAADEQLKLLLKRAKDEVKIKLRNKKVIEADYVISLLLDSSSYIGSDSEDFNIFAFAGSRFEYLKKEMKKVRLDFFIDEESDEESADAMMDLQLGKFNDSYRLKLCICKRE